MAGSTAPGLATMTLAFGGICTVSGTPGFAITCSPGAWDALNYTGGTTFATAGTGNTTWHFPVDCRLSAGATACSTITGFLHGDHVNPSAFLPDSSYTVVTDWSLRSHKIGAGCAAVPNGTATFGKPDAGSGVLDITYVIDGPNAPYIFRTP